MASRKRTKKPLTEERQARRRISDATYYATHRKQILQKKVAHRAAHLEEMRAKDAVYSAAHREEKRVYNAAYLDAHREENRVGCAAYRLTHLEERRAYDAAYYQEHREERIADVVARDATQPAVCRAREARWRKAHPEYVQVKDGRRQARKRAAPVSDFTVAQWQAMQVAYDHRCVYCGKRFKGKLTQDHITPFIHGGSHTASNIVPACRSCNGRKSAGPVPIPVQPLLLIA